MQEAKGKELRAEGRELGAENSMLQVLSSTAYALSSMFQACGDENMKDDTTLINEVLEKVPNKYKAVIVASKRAKAINDETVRPLVRASAKKPTTIALEEIAAGLVADSEARPELEAAEKKEKELLTSPDESTAEEK